MLHFPRTTFALLAIPAIAVPAYPQESPRPQESPWAMRAPVAVPHGGATLSPQQREAMKQAEMGTPEQQALARKVVTAMSLKDVAAIKLLIAPSALKCIGKHQDFLMDRIQKQLALPISKDYSLKITKLPDKLLNESKYATFPMRPTHLMGMQFQTVDGETATVNLTIGQEDGKWYEAQPCPTQAGMDRFNKLQQQRALTHARAAADLAQVKEPIKSQLLAHINQRDNVGAWRLCMASLHYDFPTCRGIVAILAGQDTD